MHARGLRHVVKSVAGLAHDVQHALVCWLVWAHESDVYMHASTHTMHTTYACTASRMSAAKWEIFKDTLYFCTCAAVVCQLLWRNFHRNGEHIFESVMIIKNHETPSERVAMLKIDRDHEKRLRKRDSADQDDVPRAVAELCERRRVMKCRLRDNDA